MTAARIYSIVALPALLTLYRMLAQGRAGKEVFMQPSHFCVGDRVHTLQSLATLPARSTGTIYRVARVGNFYGVLFDGEAVIRVLHHNTLERASLQERAVGTSLLE